MKKTLCIALPLLIILSTLLTGCAPTYHKYSDTFYDCFDTVIQVIGYAQSPEDFAEIAEYAHQRFWELHKLYDIYHDYEGIQSIKTINGNAGIQPVKVDMAIIDLLQYAKTCYRDLSPKVNVAMGAVLNIWHEARTAGINDPANAKLPSTDALKEANKLTNLDKVIIDEEARTVYLEEKGMRLDVGAIAKGYATELIAKELEEKGYTSLLISSGGNVCVIGEPLDDRDYWGVGVENPFDTEGGALLDTIYAANQSVVTSGNYQRYYTVNGKRYHHLIDPETLYPADYFASVTIMARSSVEADFLSTAIFLSPYDEGLKLINKIDGVEAVWVFPDGTIKATDGMKRVMKKLGGASKYKSSEEEQ